MDDMYSSAASDSDNPYPEKDIDGLMDGQWELDIGKIFSQSWELFLANAGQFIGAIAVYMVASVLLAIVSVCTLGLGMAAVVPLMAGMTIYTMMLLKGERPDFNNFFDGFKLFLPLFIAGLLIGLGTFLGSILCVVPGLYLGVAWYFALPLIIDRKMEAVEAMSMSMKVVNSNFWAVFVLALVVAIISFAGAVVMLGTLITAPLASIMGVVAYAQLFGLRDGPIVEA